MPSQQPIKMQIKTLEQKSSKKISSLQNKNICQRRLKLMAQVTSVTFKDHKENFMSHPTTGLIKSSKGETRRVSKDILDQKNTGKLCVNEWENTISVISKM